MDNSNNVVIEVETFNKARQPTKAKIFRREIKRPGANTRTSWASLGNDDCYFVFVGTTALICIESSDARDFYFAFDAERAEACLDETLDRYRDRADEDGYDFGDWRQAQAYIAAAEILRDKVYPPKIPAYCARDYGWY